MIKIGCCGFPVSQELYYKTFNCCEIQITFYTFPNLSLLEKWRKKAPLDFSFILKASQLITHPASSPTYKRFQPSSFPLVSFVEKNFGLFRLTKETKTAWEETKRQAEVLKTKVILLQTPPSFSEVEENIENIYSFFSKIDRKNLTLVWEPRGRWQDETLKKISQELNLILAFDPMRKLPISGLFQKKGKTPCAFYFRLHGGKGYRHKFTQEELNQIAQEAISRKDGYIMFNNITMFEDAKNMKEIMEEFVDESRGIKK
ncbi:MAG: DUF72 domain-containing protein [candidate division WOR-3 bacterium]